jgi:subtilisin
VQALTTAKLAKPGARARLTDAQALVLPNLRMGIVSLPRELLLHEFGEENVIADERLFLPKSAAFAEPEGSAAPCFQDDEMNTWGRQAVNVTGNERTGRGVKVCIIDSGLATKHVDFRNRPNLVMKEFNGIDIVEDMLGHGTHCTGIVCGPKSPNSLGRRYGVAPDVELFVANVFGLVNVTFPSLVCEAVEWALSQGCRIASLSIERPVPDENDTKHRQDVRRFEELADRASKEGMLLVACTGNSSRRDKNSVANTAFPACCPSVLAVGAVDRCLNVWNQSNFGAEVFAPGYDVLSSWKLPDASRRMVGTSMATAFVSGVAALLCEDSELRGAALRDRLIGGNGKEIKPSEHEPAARVVRVQ